MSDTYIGDNGINTSKLSAKEIVAGTISVAGDDISETLSELFYSTGDTMTIGKDTPLPAYVSNSRKSIYFSIPLNKPLKGVTDVSLSGVLVGRGITGYLYNPNKQGTSDDPAYSYNLSKSSDEKFSISCKISGSYIKGRITFDNALKVSSATDAANITNNTPASIITNRTLTITFS